MIKDDDEVRLLYLEEILADKDVDILRSRKMKF